MAQLSVVNYFNNKKRAVPEDGKLNNARKVLILDEDNLKPAVPLFLESQAASKEVTNRIVVAQNGITPKIISKKVNTPKRNKKCAPNQGNILPFVNSVGKINFEHEAKSSTTSLDAVQIESLNGVSSVFNDETDLTQSSCVKPECDQLLSHQGKVQENNAEQTDLTLEQIKQKLNRSSRLEEIRASLARFKQSESKLEAAKQKTQETKDAVTLKKFKTLEFEINLSPQKTKSPEKPYLSPKKEVQSPRRNLFGLPSPVKKETPSVLLKPTLTLPYKYRYLAEIFRSIDTVCQIMYNRKETITFRKLKPAVEEMLKRNLTEKHIAQLNHLYPDAFALRREKMKDFGAGSRSTKWELVFVPRVPLGEQLSAEILLQRRRKLFDILIEKVKDYHQEFLRTFDPPLEIERSKITRWHPLFDIEILPDIEVGELPLQPIEETFTSGSDVLQKAREMFSCNTRMERALERLQQSSQSTNIPDPPPVTSILKGIPKALLDKVRQKQAAKALESITRSAAKEKEVHLYSKLPEIARLARNLFVTEKKSVLSLEVVVDRLCISYKGFLKNTDMENYLRTIAKETNGWLVFHEIRGDIFIKLSRNSDLNVIMNDLQKLADLKDS